MTTVAHEQGDEFLCASISSQNLGPNHLAHGPTWKCKSLSCTCH